MGNSAAALSPLVRHAVLFGLQKQYTPTTTLLEKMDAIRGSDAAKCALIILNEALKGHCNVLAIGQVAKGKTGCEPVSASEADALALALPCVAAAMQEGRDAKKAKGEAKKVEKAAAVVAAAGAGEGDVAAVGLPLSPTAAAAAAFAAALEGLSGVSSDDAASERLSSLVDVLSMSPFLSSLLRQALPLADVASAAADVRRVEAAAAAAAAALKANAYAIEQARLQALADDAAASDSAAAAAAAAAAQCAAEMFAAAADSAGAAAAAAVVVVKKAKKVPATA